MEPEAVLVLLHRQFFRFQEHLFFVEKLLLCREFSAVMHDPENAGKKMTTADTRAGYESGGGL